MHQVINDLQENTFVLVRKGDLIDFASSIVEEYKQKESEALKASNEEEYYNSKQTCDLLNVARSTLHRWVKGGMLKPYVIGGRNKFSKNEIKALISSGR